MCWKLSTAKVFRRVVSLLISADKLMHCTPNLTPLRPGPPKWVTSSVIYSSYLSFGDFSRSTAARTVASLVINRSQSWVTWHWLGTIPRFRALFEQSLSCIKHVKQCSVIIKIQPREYVYDPHYPALSWRLLKEKTSFSFVNKLCTLTAFGKQWFLLLSSIWMPR